MFNFLLFSYEKGNLCHIRKYTQKKNLMHFDSHTYLGATKVITLVYILLETFIITYAPVLSHLFTYNIFHFP